MDDREIVAAREDAAAGGTTDDDLPPLPPPPPLGARLPGAAERAGQLPEPFEPPPPPGAGALWAGWEHPSLAIDAFAPAGSAADDEPGQPAPIPAAYRAGQAPATGDAPAAPQQHDSGLPKRRPGQTQAAQDSPWAAFADSWQEPASAKPAGAEPWAVEPAPALSPESPVVAVVHARARASVPGAAPLSAADVVEAMCQGAPAPRTYRAGEASDPAHPAEPPRPVEPPAPPQPPEPASPPEPPSPPEPV
jgi:hypothetical protein